MLPRIFRQPPHYLVGGQFVSPLFTLRLAEGAEPAAVHAYIGRVYMAVHYEIGVVSIPAFGKSSGKPADAEQIVAFKKENRFIEG
jgi:hypothetical protein